MNKPLKNPFKIQSMFSSIAPRYDLLNRLLSFGRDIYWRRFAVNQLPGINKGSFLDVATGTCDIAIEILRQGSQKTKVTGVDFSGQMLRLGKEKIIKRGCQNQIELCYGDTTLLPFEDNTFDASIIAFGIRNIPDYKTGIKEMTRVVKENGKIVILEFTPLERQPFLTGFTSVQSRFFRRLFRLYLTRFLPFIGGMVSGKKDAYKYLSESVLDFPDPEGLKRIMEEAGLKKIAYYPLTFSIVTVHVGVK